MQMPSKVISSLESAQIAYVTSHTPSIVDKSCDYTKLQLVTTPSRQVNWEM